MAGRDIDEPERKGRHQAQEQQIAQRILLEALAQLGEPGRGALASGSRPERERAIRNRTVAPMVAPTTAARPPSSQPNSSPPAAVRMQAARQRQSERRRRRRRYRPARESTHVLGKDMMEAVAQRHDVLERHLAVPAHGEHQQPWRRRRRPAAQSAASLASAKFDLSAVCGGCPRARALRGRVQPACLWPPGTGRSACSVLSIDGSGAHRGAG